MYSLHPDRHVTLTINNSIYFHLLFGIQAADYPTRIACRQAIIRNITGHHASRTFL